MHWPGARSYCVPTRAGDAATEGGVTMVPPAAPIPVEAADDRVRVARHGNDRIDVRRRRGKRAQQHGRNLLVLRVEMLRHLIQTKVFSQNWLPRIVPLAFSDKTTGGADSTFDFRVEKVPMALFCDFGV